MINRRHEEETDCNDESNGNNSRAGHDAGTVWQQSYQRRHQRLSKHIKLGPQSLRHISASTATCLCKADDRRTIIFGSADFLVEIRTSSTAKFIAEISADKIGRVTYKN